MLDELQWEPGVKVDNITVGAKDGMVTLAGFVARAAVNALEWNVNVPHDRAHRIRLKGRRTHEKGHF